jgi:hypothetical protein
MTMLAKEVLPYVRDGEPSKSQAAPAVAAKG